MHAIGAGVLLAEIQEMSDATFRIYDWGRLGTDGKPRPLHIREAMESIDFERGPVDPITPEAEPITAAGHSRAAVAVGLFRPRATDSDPTDGGGISRPIHDPDGPGGQLSMVRHGGESRRSRVRADLSCCPRPWDPARSSRATSPVLDLRGSLMGERRSRKMCSARR